MQSLLPPGRKERFEGRLPQGILPKGPPWPEEVPSRRPWSKGRRVKRGEGNCPRGKTSQAVFRTVGTFSLAGLVLFFWAGLSATAADRNERPNIVFILSDNQNWRFMSCAGHPFLETPNMDRLAREGILFRNAFVATSLCSPSRASFLTGQYAHTHGVQNNFTPWDGKNRTFLEVLYEAGYDTAFIGKWHMPGGLPELKGVEPFVTFTIQGGQGRYLNCPLIVNGQEKPSRKPYITEELTDYALEFIGRERQKPFCLYLSHKAVHHRWTPPAHLVDLYEGEKPVFPEGFDPWILLTRGHMLEGTNQGFAGSLYKDYCRTIVALDEQVGRLLNRLDELGIAENTIVVYVSDNGFFWGEHKLFGTGRWPYEESIRVPFIVRYPGVIPDAGRKADQMVLNIDVAPTFLEIAGIPVPEEIEGESFVPILESTSAPGRQAFLYEYFKDFPYRVPPTRGIRTERYMYIEYEGRRKPELYDVGNDPGEKKNLMSTAEGKELARELRGRMESL
jgi:arylsulfatase A-like enzyme